MQGLVSLEQGANLPPPAGVHTAPLPQQAATLFQYILTYSQAQAGQTFGTDISSNPNRQPLVLPLPWTCSCQTPGQWGTGAPRANHLPSGVPSARSQGTIDKQRPSLTRASCLPWWCGSRTTTPGSTQTMELARSRTLSHL